MSDSSGFHLLELLIVLAIVSLFATIAIPQYDIYLRRTYRLEAMATLSKLAIEMEQFYLQNNTYEGVNLHLANYSGKDHYQLAIQSQSPQDYLLIASPIGAQQADTCGVLTINELGEKHARSEDCW